MRTIAIEEHFSVPGSIAGGGPLSPTSVDAYMAEVGKRLADLGEGRLADMDDSGIDMQVLSLTALGADLDSAGAEAANDLLAEAVRKQPRRFAGFATLPMRDPGAAAAELERSVSKLGLVGAVVDGTTDGKFLDDPRFEPLLAAAQKLGVPIYLHPAPPPMTVFDAYYRGLPEEAAQMLSISGFGWHVELGLHSLRLILSGVFDRFPRLQIVIGHMGEFIPYSFSRSDLILSRAATHLERRVGDYFRSNFHITTSGYFTLPPLQCAISIVGVERILFAVDYPYSPNRAGRNFLDSLPLAPPDLERITHGNAERLLKLPS